MIELGGGVGIQGVTYMLPDTVNDRLFLAGSFAYANDLPVSPGALEWGPSGFVSLGCGVEWDCVTPGSQAGLANPTLALAIWNGDLYLGGAIFFTRNGVEYNGIMRWDGNEWYPVGNGTDGKVTSLKVIDGDLIAAGWFTYADTVLANGLARWDGERWHRVHDVPQFFPGDPNYLQDVVKFQGDWYIGGNVASIRHLAKWNGSSWEIVGGGFTGTFSQVNKLRVFDGRLYVAGSFARCAPNGNPSNPGSGIVAWDGTAWDHLGGGTCGASNPAVVSMTWWHNELYACGLFNRIGAQQGHRLAKWDGQQWCMLAPPGFWGNGGPGALTVFHDSLYIGGAFIEAGGEPVSCFAKWIGGDYTYACGTVTNIPEEVNAEGTIHIAPNPATDNFTVNSSAIILHYRLLDLNGRAVLTGNVNAQRFTIERNGLAPGTYFLELTLNDGRLVRKVMFE